MIKGLIERNPDVPDGTPVSSMGTETRRIRRKLIRDGWYLSRHGAIHDVYRHPTIGGIITLPRHRYVSKGVAASIARKSKWFELENDDDEQVSSAD